MGRRWERLADLLHDLDDLRERGERLITRARSPDEPDAPEPPDSGGEAHGGDAEGAQRERAVDGADGPAP